MLFPTCFYVTDCDPIIIILQLCLADIIYKHSEDFKATTSIFSFPVKVIKTLQIIWPLWTKEQHTSQDQREAMLIILAFLILFHLGAAILLFVATIHNVSTHHEYLYSHGTGLYVLEFIAHVPPCRRRGGWCRTKVMSSTLICGTLVTSPATPWRTATLLPKVRFLTLLSHHECELFPL